MDEQGFRHLYGPVPSRRLGRSLGIDLVPLKTCTYDCVYCQLGRTTHLTLEPREWAPAEAVLAELARRLATGDRPDYLALAGSGEPTLHPGLGRLLAGIKRLTDLPVAVLTNGALLFRPEVQEALLPADLVLPSLDAGDEATFQAVNRPHPALSLARVAEGIAGFGRRFPGELWLEVLLVEGLNADEASVAKIAALAREIAPARVQLNTVSRPPAEPWAKGVAPARLLALRERFPGRVEIIHEAGGETAAPGRAGEEEVVALLRRRPCTAEGVARGLGIHLNEALKLLAGLVQAGRARMAMENGRNFYLPPEGARQSTDQAG